MTRSPVGERGFTLIEVLVAMALMSIGIAATLSVFGGSSRTTLAAQRVNVASEKAQGALDKLTTTAYDKLGLTSTPASSTNALDPGYRVSGTTFTVKTGLTESFVLSTDTGQSAASIDPTPEAFTVGTGGSAITGKIYRYVTWRDEKLPGQSPSETQDSKRATVAVAIDASGTLPARAPIWISQVIPDPKAIKTGAATPPPSAGGSAPLSAQNFYLYDTPCNQTSRVSPSANHATHNTASAAPPAAASSYSVCENSGIQPDLMWKDVPTGTSSTPLYDYSNDLSGSYTGGLATTRKGTTCPTSYPSANYNVSSAAVNKWSIHAWSSNTFSSIFSITGQVTLSLFTATLGGASGKGDVCATLLDRSVSGGVPTDTSLGSFTYSLASWPTTLRRLSFTFNVPSAPDVPAGHRLVLVLGVKGSSDNDIYFVYDHPSYASFLQVATDTPF
jgi:prepilin-type N-terminal cleavage/methylation domain-containing protein